MLFTFTLRDDASIKRYDLDGLHANAVCASRFAQGAELGIADSKGSSNRLDSFKALTSRKNSPILPRYIVIVCVYFASKFAEMELVLLLTWETSLRRGLPESHLHPRMASTHTHGQSQNLSGNVKYKLIISSEAKSLIKGYIQGASKNEFCRMSVTSPQKFYYT